MLFYIIDGPIIVNLTEVAMKDIESTPLDIAPGGHYAPRHCKPNDRVAIVIPYRFVNNHP